jgi:hypothetical protein
MRWITRQDVKLDRVACPWLIRRFMGRRWSSSSHPKTSFSKRARQEGVTPFDAARFPEVQLNHRGERCTFEDILEDYKPTDPAQHRLGLIVRGADGKGQEQVSESIGWRAIAQGFALSGISVKHCSNRFASE